MEITEKLAYVLEGTTPESQDRLADLLHDMDTYISFGNNAVLAFLDADGGYVVGKEAQP